MSKEDLTVRRDEAHIRNGYNTLIILISLMVGYLIFRYFGV